MKRSLHWLVLLGGLAAAGGAARAETAAIEVFHLPLDEAARAARTQLSDAGVVTTLPSRKLLILKDDAAHIRQARQLLRRLDAPAAQLVAEAEVLEFSDESGAGLAVAARLPGGWARVNLAAGRETARHRRRLRLHITAGRPARIEAGTIHAIQAPVRELMHRHGWADNPDFSLIPVTAGFDIVARLVDERHARVRIHPWFARTRRQASAAGRIEILPDLGATDAPRTPPEARAGMRLNLNPNEEAKTERIAIAEADTELTVPLDETIALAATSEAARVVADALLAHGASIGRRTLVMQFRISRGTTNGRR